MTERSATALLSLPTMFAILGLAAPAAGGDMADAAELSDLARCESICLSTCPQPFYEILPPAEDMLSWDQPGRVIGFRNTYRLYQGDVFRTLGGKVFPLPAALYKMPAVRYHMDGQTYRLADYLRRQNVTGLLVLKDARVVYEYYGSGNSSETLWTSRSVAKSVVSILVGMAIKERLIGSVADLVTRYLPEL